MPTISNVASNITKKRIALVVTRWSRSAHLLYAGPRLVPGWVTVFRRVNYLGYVTRHPGQLSLAIPPWAGAMRTSLGCEGNQRSGIALAMCHRQQHLVYSPMGSTAMSGR